MTSLFVTGIGTDIGKTYVTAALIRALRAKGRPVEAFKPVISGFDPDRLVDSDAGALLAALGRPVAMETVEAISPFRYAAPMSPPLAAAREGRTLDFEEIAGACRARMSGEGLLLIEGAGGLMSPLTERTTGLDLIQALGAPVLLVAGTYLGAISHTLTALEALKAHGVAVKAVALNESPDPGASLDETRASLAAFTDIALATVRRGGDASDLAALLD